MKINEIVYKKVISMLKGIVKTEVISSWLENKSLDIDNKLVPLAVICYLKCRKWGI